MSTDVSSQPSVRSSGPRPPTVSAFFAAATLGIADAGNFLFRPSNNNPSARGRVDGVLDDDEPATAMPQLTATIVATMARTATGRLIDASFRMDHVLLLVRRSLAGFAGQMGEVGSPPPRARRSGSSRSRRAPESPRAGTG